MKWMKKTSGDMCHFHGCQGYHTRLSFAGHRRQEESLGLGLVVVAGAKLAARGTAAREGRVGREAPRRREDESHRGVERKGEQEGPHHGGDLASNIPGGA